MNILLKLEYLALFLLSIVIFYTTDYVWWLYLVLFLIPDVGMIGYMINTKVGALTYNLTHHYSVAVMCLMSGLLLTAPVMTLAGSILLGHSAFDRLVGYGLKYSDSFKHTHLKNL